MYMQWNITRPKKRMNLSLLLRWMNLEPVIQSEVSQKEKSKYSILTHMWNLEKWYDEPICREGMETQIKRTNLWTQWEKERVG